MRIAIYHNLPDGGAIRALHELVKHSYREVEYDIYQLAPVDTKSRYDFGPYVKRHRAYGHIYAPTKKDFAFEIATQFGALRKLQKQIASEIDSQHYDAVFVHHCAISQTPFLLEYLQTKSLYFIQEPRRLSYEADFYRESRALIPQWMQPFWVRRQKILTRLDAQNARRASSALCNSQYMKNAIQQAYGISATICYLGIDDKTFTYASTIAKKRQLLVVGTLHPAKAQQLAIEAVALLESSQRPQLILVYENFDDRYRTTLRQLAQQKSVDLVLKQGVSDTELVTLYRQSQATLCMAEREPFGFTPIESAACGTPVIAIAEGGFLETVRPVNGLLVKRDAQLVADAIMKVMKKSWDSRVMSQKTRKQWNWQSSAKTYLAALTELIHD